VRPVLRNVPVEDDPDDDVAVDDVADDDVADDDVAGDEDRFESTDRVDMGPPSVGGERPSSDGAATSTSIPDPVARAGCVISPSPCAA